MGATKDITGNIYGYLTAVSKTTEKTKTGTYLWNCLCKCGNILKVPISSLTTGHTKSCGCWYWESRKKFNKYDITDDFGIGYTSENEEFYFNLDDFDKIKEYYWRTDRKGYLITDDFNNNGQKIKMHRLIMSCSYGDGKIVDHMNFNKKDNRKENLRLVTPMQNSQWQRLRPTNTSGVTGVGNAGYGNKWIAYIDANKERIHLGTFDTFEEAVKVRLTAEKHYFGEFSPQKDLFDQYCI